MSLWRNIPFKIQSVWRNITFKIQSYGVTYRSKFSLGIFPIEKLIFMSEIN